MSAAQQETSTRPPGRRAAWARARSRAAFLLLGCAGATAASADFEIGPPLGLDPTTYSEVPVLAVSPGGRLLIAGQFDQVDGLRPRGIAALRADGSVDPGFDDDCRPPVTQPPTERCTISRILVEPGGSMIVSGAFSGFGNVPRTGLAKLDAETGQVDAEWNPAATLGTPIAIVGDQVLLWSSAGSGTVSSVDLHGRGDPTPGFVPFHGPAVLAHNGRDALWLVRTQAGASHVVRASALTGVVDPHWRSRELASVTGLAYDDQGDTLFIAGTAPQDSGSPFWLVRMRASGPAEEMNEWRQTAELRRLDSPVVREGYLYGFVRDSHGSERVWRFDLDLGGSRDLSYVSPWGGRALLGVDAAGRALIHMYGFWDQDDWLPGGSTLQRLGADGRYDLTFRPWVRRDAGVSAIARAANGDVLLFGLTVSGVGARRSNGFFRLDPTYRHDAVWAPEPIGQGSLQFDEFGAMAIDSAARMYVSSKRADDSGSSWPPSLLRIGDDGQPDADWNASGQVYDALQASIYEYVHALLIDEANGWLYVGGNFDGVVCGERRRNLVRVTLASPCTADASWQPEPDGPVEALFLDPSGRLYVGGSFERIAGMEHLALARFDGGLLDASWRPLEAGPGRYAVHELVADDERVFAALAFAPFGGQSAEGLVRVDAIAGEVDAAWQPPAASEVADLLLTASGRLLAARRGISHRYEFTHFALESFDPAGNGQPEAVLRLPAGQRIDALAQGRDADAVLVAGNFKFLGNEARRGVAELFVQPRGLFASGFE